MRVQHTYNIFLLHETLCNIVIGLFIWPSLSIEAHLCVNSLHNLFHGNDKLIDRSTQSIHQFIDQ